VVRVIFLLFALSPSFGQATSEGRFAGNVPKEVYQLMKQRECRPIEGFYDRDINSPSFIYVSGLFGTSTAIFFACKSDIPITRGKYKIVLMKKNITKDGVTYSDFEDCPNEIHYENMPGGLSLRVRLNDKKLVLDDYNLWENTKKYIWNNENLLHIHTEDMPLWVLDERREGVGYGFFCVKGKWYNLSYD